jgi:hypothetical protein
MSETVQISEREAMRVAEAAREKEWTRPSFMREMFLGNFRLDLVHPSRSPIRRAPSSRPSTMR